MKKQKLQYFAKLAALSVVGAMPVFGFSVVSAQQSEVMLPPIVQGTVHNADPSASNADFSYDREASTPITPSFLMPSNTMLPPIVAGDKPETSKSSLLAPIGSGLIEQVSAPMEPSSSPMIARAFSPAKIPVRQQGSGTRNVLAPATQMPAPAIVQPSNMLAPQMQRALPGAGMAVPAAPPTMSRSLVPPPMTGALDDAPMTVAPEYFNSAPINDPIPMQSVVAGCSDCGGSGCSTCGDGEAPDGRRINCDYGTYGSVSSARRYAYLEAMYMTREDGDITNSNFNPLGEFDFGLSWRFTLGQRPDMTQGREISYFGTSGIENRQVTNNANNRLNALFSPAGGIISGDLSAFFDASQHIQFKETNVHSIEFNRVRWGWDVLKSFVGWRYVYMDDQYQLDSTSSFDGAFPVAEETGRYRIDTVNHLIGAHIGAELFYDIGYRFSLSGISKFGAYANINKVDNYLENNGTVLLDAENNGANISTTYELSLLAHYQLRQTARLRFGYNGMFLGSVATVSDNFSAFVSPFTGFNSSDDDDAFIHGFSFGLELYR